MGFAQLRVARANHDVIVTGPALVLATMVPGAPAQTVGGQLRFVLAFVDWLLLGIIHPGADIPIGTELAAFMIHALVDVLAPEFPARSFRS